MNDVFRNIVLAGIRAIPPSKITSALAPAPWYFRTWKPAPAVPWLLSLVTLNSLERRLVGLKSLIVSHDQVYPVGPASACQRQLVHRRLDGCRRHSHYPRQTYTRSPGCAKICHDRCCHRCRRSECWRSPLPKPVLSLPPFPVPSPYRPAELR